MKIVPGTVRKCRNPLENPTQNRFSVIPFDVPFDAERFDVKVKNRGKTRNRGSFRIDWSFIIKLELIKGFHFSLSVYFISFRRTNFAILFPRRVFPYIYLPFYDWERNLSTGWINRCHKSRCAALHDVPQLSSWKRKYFSTSVLQPCKPSK